MRHRLTIEVDLTDDQLREMDIVLAQSIGSIAQVSYMGAIQSGAYGSYGPNEITTISTPMLSPCRWSIDQIYEEDDDG